MYGVVPQDIRDAGYGVDIEAGEAVDTQLTRLIAKAEVRLNAAVPTLAARFEADEVEADVIKGVIEDMVLRVVKNPDSLRSFSIDDFTGTIDNAVSSGALFVTDDELALLTPAGRAVGSILLGVPAWRLPRGC